MAAQLKPFLQGSRQIWKQIAAIPFAEGLQAPDTKIPKNGYLGSLRFRFVGNADVTVAGSAGTPNLWMVIGRYLLTLSGNYQYRNVDGESLLVMDSARAPFGSTDPVLGDPSYLNYPPQTTGNHAISYTVKDDISLNSQVNADEFLLAAQARNYDIILSLTFGSAAQIAANTETAAITGTLYVEGAYQLDAVYSEFEAPDLTYVQQIVDDASFTSVTVGSNVVPVNPINGPEYMQLLMQPRYNNAIDTQGPNSATTSLILRVNNQQEIWNTTAQALVSENFRHLGMRQLPLGYYLFDFMDDVSLQNAMSPYRTRLIGTGTLNSFELLVNVASGTTTTNSRLKLIKRLRNPAVN